MSDEPYVIVGSGPAAAAAATQLVARGLPVTVLNDGSLVPPGWVVRINGRSVFRRDRQIGLECIDETESSSEWIKTASLGGLTNYWTAAVPRFEPHDFTMPGELDHRHAWPIGYDDLEPWYEAAESLLTVTGAAEPEMRGTTQTTFVRPTPSDWQEIVESIGLTGVLTPSAIGRPTFIARRPREFESYRTVLRPMERSGKIEVRAGMTVEQIRWSSADQRAVGVEARDSITGQQRFFPARAVLLAAGAIDSIAILLRSTSADHPGGLGNTHGVLGRFVTDHPRLWCELELDRKLTALDLPILLRNSGTAEVPLGWQQSIGILTTPDRLRSWFGGKTDRFGVNTFGTNLPVDRQHVRLVPHDDGHTVPQVALTYNEETLAVLRDSVPRLQSELAQLGINATAHNVWMSDAGDSVHYTGGARMHHDAKLGVVDAGNQVRGANGVYVCDSACFTTLPEKNPTLTSMAIAMRAASLIAA